MSAPRLETGLGFLMIAIQQIQPILSIDPNRTRLFASLFTGMLF
jgi:hypothetical protein